MKKFLVVSTDEEYITNILGALTDDLSEEYQIEVISDMEYLKRYMEIPHKVDTLLFDEILLSINQANQDVSHSYFITETDKIGSNIISKYSGVQGVMKILGVGYLKSNKKANSIGKTRIHDVVSVVDPQIKTLVSLAVAKQLSAYGRRVLYLSAENLQDFQVFLKEADSLSGEEEALKINAILKGITGGLDQLIKNKGFDYIAQFDRLLSSYGMSSETIIHLAEAIGKLDIFDEIVIEHPFGFSKESVTRMENSKSIIIITDQTPSSKRKLEKLLNNTKEIKMNSLLVCYPSDIGSGEEMFGNTFCDVNICEKSERLSMDITVEDVVNKKIFRNTAEAVL